MWSTWLVYITSKVGEESKSLEAVETPGLVQFPPQSRNASAEPHTSNHIPFLYTISAAPKLVFISLWKFTCYSFCAIPLSSPKHLVWSRKHDEIFLAFSSFLLDALGAPSTGAYRCQPLWAPPCQSPGTSFLYLLYCCFFLDFSFSSWLYNFD